jgi:hypothetical protein
VVAFVVTFFALPFAPVGEGNSAAGREAFRWTARAAWADSATGPRGLQLARMLPRAGYFLRAEKVKSRINLLLRHIALRLRCHYAVPDRALPSADLGQWPAPEGNRQRDQATGAFQKGGGVTWLVLHKNQVPLRFAP